ncbi:MAG: STAS domain-containing protein [Magnetococcales bacterium]|nr:STAS domain-containing protein [Magnetococcales bacterium]
MPGIISTSRSAQATTIHVQGRFNFEMYAQFRAAYREDTQNGHDNRHFIVDLAGAEYIDSAALGMLIMLREETDTRKTNVEIVNACPEIREILTTANFNRLFKVM